jgi:beta-carotene 3-hydroxylase
VVETKEGTVSFGFLVAPSPESLKAELKRRERAGVRAPSLTSSSRT